MNSKVFIEYSVTQKAFYYDTVEEILKKNISSMEDNISNDYKVIAIVNDFEEATDFIEKIRKIKGM